MRLDAYLQLQYTSHSRSLLQKMIKAGHVKINGEVEIRPKVTVSEDDVVVLDTKSLQMPEGELELPVLYEDSNCVVIDKPLGVLVHSKGAYNPEATVATWLKGRKDYAFPADAERGGIVHRLDRATSGVMICAKNKVTLGKLQKQFQIRKTKKTYIARVNGIPKPAHAELDLPIERNPKQPQTFRVGINGKSAQTEYKVLEDYGDTALVELKPYTGRTHQLRVHLQYIKHPIIGDTLYGGKEADRMYLHAKSLEITIPTSERMTFESEIPREFTETL